MNDHNNDENRAGVSAWEDDGGAPPSDAGRRTDTARGASDRRRSGQERLDASHESDTRGEHRYDDIHQTGPEQKARQERDELKRRLAGRDTRHAGQGQQR
jgi:hypothetical protein